MENRADRRKRERELKKKKSQEKNTQAMSEIPMGELMFPLMVARAIPYILSAGIGGNQKNRQDTFLAVFLILYLLFFSSWQIPASLYL